MLRRVKIREKTKIGEYLVADSIEAIVALIQIGVVEIHTWNSRTDRIEQPDRIVWDLDPSPQVAWTQTVKAARLLRSILKLLDLESWVKTTGGRGLHVVVPLDPERDWAACLSFARAMAQSIERTDRSRYTTAFGKRGRERKILIDYLRNNRTNTSTAAFSTRARHGAPVSVPIPWREYWTRRQRITDPAMTAIQRL